MQESKSTLLFRTVDYRVFKDGYLFKLIDDNRRASYELVFAPFNLRPSVLMLDFILADSNRGAALNNDLITMIKQDFCSDSSNDFIVLGAPENGRGGNIDKALSELIGTEQDKYTVVETALISSRQDKDAEMYTPISELSGYRDDEYAELDGAPHKLGNLEKQGALSEIGESTRIHNKKKLHKVSKVAFSRDVLNELGKLSHTEIAFRLDRDKLVVDKVGASNREYVSKLDILGVNDAIRTSSFGTEVTKELGVYLRPYMKDTYVNKDLLKSERSNIFGLGVINDITTANRSHRQSLSVEFANNFAMREISKGFLYTNFKLLDFYVEIIPRHLNLMRPEILASRELSKHTISELNNILLSHRDSRTDAIIQNVVNSTRDDRHNVEISDSLILARKKAHQYPSHMHFLGKGNRIEREDVYLQAVSDVVRDITKGDLIKSQEVLRFERDINKSLVALKNKLKGYREERKISESPASIEKTLISAYRDIFQDSHVIDDRIVGDRIYFVKAMVNSTQPQGERKYDNVLHLSHNQLQGGRDVSQKAHNDNTEYTKLQALRDSSNELVNSVSEMYHRDSRTGLYIPTEQQQAYRPRKDMLACSNTEGERANTKDTYVSESQSWDRDTEKDSDVSRVKHWDRDNIKETYKSYSQIWERDIFSELVTTDSVMYKRDNTNTLDIEYLQIYDRLSRKLTHLRDEWLEILVNGGELPENGILDALLMDDMLFGELLESPAWIEEYTIMGDALTPKIGVITADLIDGTRHKIQALIDSDILLSSREGDVPGEIIAINYDAIKLEKDSTVIENTNFAVKDSSEVMVEYPDLMAERVTIPKYGWLDDLENPLGYLDGRESKLQSSELNGTRDKTTGKVLDAEQLATRPDQLKSHLEQGTSVGTRSTRYGNIKEGGVLSSRGDSFATVNDSNTQAERLDKSAHTFSDNTTASRVDSEAVYIESDRTTGKLWDREGTLMDNVKNLLGAAYKKATSMIDRVWAGNRADRGGFKDSLPTEGTKLIKGGVTDDSPNIGTKTDKGGLPYDLIEIATRTEKEGISIKDSETMGEQLQREGGTNLKTLEAIKSDVCATVNDTDLMGRRTDKDGSIQDAPVTASDSAKKATLEEMQLAELRGRLASAVVDFIFAQNEEKEAEGLDAIIGAVKQDKAFSLIEHMTYYKDKKNGELEEQVLATPEKLGDVIKGIFATPEKYGIHMDSSILGQGVLHDYNDDLLREGNDVEKWGDGYGFGVPDDYDPLDPFNNYYPYTSDYTSHELAQAISWTKGSEFEFKADTDIIKLSTPQDSVAVADVSGDNYKFSVDFCVSGNKDTAVDIVIRYTNENNYYVFRVNGGDRAGMLNMSDNMQLYKVSYGEYSPIGYPMSPHKWVKGTWHRVEVSMLENGSKLVIKVDDRVQYDMRGY